MKINMNSRGKKLKWKNQKEEKRNEQKVERNFVENICKLKLKQYQCTNIVSVNLFKLIYHILYWQ